MRSRPWLGGPVVDGMVKSPVGVANWGKKKLPPGVVVKVCPLGAVQMTVPSGRCWSAHPDVPV